MSARSTTRSETGGMDWAAFDALTPAQVREAAMSDPDSQSLSGEQLARFRRMPLAKRIRRKLGLTQEAFAERFQIPIGTLRDWEQCRSAPDQTAKTYLSMIEHEPEAVLRAIARATAALAGRGGGR